MSKVTVWLHDGKVEEYGPRQNEVWTADESPLGYLNVWRTVHGVRESKAQRVYSMIQVARYEVTH